MSKDRMWPRVDTRWTLVLLISLTVTLTSSLPTSKEDQDNELDHKPPTDPGATSEVTDYLPPDTGLTFDSPGGPRFQLAWAKWFQSAASKFLLSLLDVRLLFNAATLGLSLLSLGQFAFQVFQAVAGIFVQRRITKRQLPADFFAKLFDPPVSPLPFNVTTNAADAILEHFRLLHITTEDCKMKVICDVSKEPQASNGVFGELVSSTFGPGESNKAAVQVFGSDKYKSYCDAADLGRKLYECGRAFTSCPKSYKDFLRASAG